MRYVSKSLLATIALWIGCSTALACKPIMMERLAFPKDSPELAPDQLAKLAAFIHRANAAYAKYTEVTIEGTASVHEPTRPLAKAKELARLRADNVTRAYKQLQPKNLDPTTTSEIFSEGGDYVYIQFHLDYDALKLPDCHPVPIPGFKR